MKTGDKIKRTDIMGDTVERVINSDSELYLYQGQLKAGYLFWIEKDGKWVEVKRPITIHKAPPESCESCSA